MKNQSLRYSKEAILWLRNGKWVMSNDNAPGGDATVEPDNAGRFKWCAVSPSGEFLEGTATTEKAAKKMARDAAYAGGSVKGIVIIQGVRGSE